MHVFKSFYLIVIHSDAFSIMYAWCRVANSVQVATCLTRCLTTAN